MDWGESNDVDFKADLPIKWEVNVNIVSEFLKRYATVEILLTSIILLNKSIILWIGNSASKSKEKKIKSCLGELLRLIYFFCVIKKVNLMLLHIDAQNKGIKKLVKNCSKCTIYRYSTLKFKFLNMEKSLQP